jgi:integrase
LIDKPTKTRSKRRLALDTSTVELLRAHRDRSEQVARELGFTLPASAYVFSREPDGSRPLAPTLVSHQFAALARSLGVRYRLHDLRHLMVTYLISQGVDWRTAAGRAGHAGPHMTLGTYAHFQPAQAAPPPSCSPPSATPRRRPRSNRHRRVRHTGMTASSDTVSEVTQMGEQAPRHALRGRLRRAPPAAHVQDLVKLAQAAGWEVAVTATPEALALIDEPLLEAITGFPVRQPPGHQLGP